MFLTTMCLPAPKYNHFKKNSKIYDKYDTAKEKLIIELKKFHDCKHVFLFGNCFGALSFLLSSLKLNNRTSVITAATSYRRTKSFIEWSGLKPFYIDNNIDHLGLDIDKLESRLKKNKNSIILAQHPMVHLLPIKNLIFLSKKYKTKLVFDSVEATGMSYNNRSIGSFGDAEVFSLHPSKVLNGGEGGYICTNSNFIKKKLLFEIKNLNQFPYLFPIDYQHIVLAISSIQSYKNTRTKLKLIYERYFLNFKTINQFKLVEYNYKNSPNFKSILVKNLSKIKTQKIINLLNKKKILARRYYYPIQALYEKNNFICGQSISEQHFILPINFLMKKNQVDFICDELRKLI